MDKKKLIIILVAIVAIAAIIVTGICTSWFGLTGGPINGLLKAFKNTALSKSLTIEIDEDGDETTIRYALDDDKKGVSYIKVEDYSDDDITILTDGYSYEYYEDYYGKKHGYKDALYPIQEVLINLHKDYIIKKSLDKLDWDEYIDDLDIKEDLDLEGESIEKFIAELTKAFSNKKWLKEFTDYSIDGNVYKFEVDIDFFEEILDMAEDCNIIDADIDADIKEELIYDWDFDKLTTKVEITVKGGKVSEIEINQKYSYGERWKFTFEFSDYNKTDIEDDMEDIIDKVKEYD